MAKKVKQIRYYAENNGNNYGGPTLRNLISGSVFSKYMPILQLGIQTMPGTKFYLNGSNKPIIVGNTGIYELDLSGTSKIRSLYFEEKSLNAINQNSHYLIIDILYEKGGTVL